MGGVAAGVGAGAKQVIQRLLAVLGHHQLIGDSRLFERAPGESDIAGIIFDQQNCFGAQLPPRFWSAANGESRIQASPTKSPTAGQTQRRSMTGCLKNCTTRRARNLGSTKNPTAADTWPSASLTYRPGARRFPPTPSGEKLD